MPLRLSIIIPVYNTEQWIARCLDSCLKQDVSHDEYEIIVVNDGTLDNAMDIVLSYASLNTNIRVVEQKNGGLSSARNTGLSIAMGQYVWFVDSDDYIEDNCLGALLSQSESDKLDVLCFKPFLLYENGDITVFEIPFESENHIYQGSDFLCAVSMPPAAWCALYSRQFLLINDLKFMVGIYHEDQEFTPRAYFSANRIAYVDKCTYNYFQRTGSIMKSANPKKAQDLLVVADSLYGFTRSAVDQGRDVYKVMMNKVSFAFAQSLANCVDVDSETIKLYQSKPYYPLAINCRLTTKEKIKYRLINVSVRLYLFVYKLFKI